MPGMVTPVPAGSFGISAAGRAQQQLDKEQKAAADKRKHKKEYVRCLINNNSFQLDVSFASATVSIGKAWKQRIVSFQKGRDSCIRKVIQSMLLLAESIISDLRN